MIKEYEIKHEPIEKNGDTINKYNIYYYHDGELFLLEFHSTDGINGTIRDGYKLKNAPNWHGLEQTLRYAENESLFTKAYSQSTEKGFNLFTTTLVNGKLGHASENALATAFAMLGVTWTDAEKAIINQILADHNFNTRI